MHMNIRMCTCTHLVKKEPAIVKDNVVEVYVVYGMNVFEYEHTEKHRQRILEKQADEAAAAVLPEDGEECMEVDERLFARQLIARSIALPTAA